jgi:hypothetical protein
MAAEFAMSTIWMICRLIWRFGANTLYRERNSMGLIKAITALNIALQMYLRRQSELRRCHQSHAGDSQRHEL